MIFLKGLFIISIAVLAILGIVLPSSASSRATATFALG